MMKKIIQILGIVILVLLITITWIKLRANDVNLPMLFIKSNQPLNIAHRGGKDLWPENTLYAFKRAVALGVDMLEMDVRSTLDDEIVVIHDETVDRTTNDSGNVNQYTLAELKKLDFAYHFKPLNSDETILRGTGITISTLDEVFQHFPHQCFNIEIKDDSEEFTKKVVNLIRNRNVVEQVLLASFHTSVIKVLSETAPDLAVSASRSEVRKLIILSKLGLEKLHQPVASVYEVPVKRKKIKIISPAFIKAARALGQQVYVWTINDSTEMRRLLNMGVDGILTDRPDLLSRELSKNNYSFDKKLATDYGKKFNKFPITKSTTFPSFNNLIGARIKQEKKLDKLYFLIHGFCYAEMEADKNNKEKELQFLQYLKRENQCANKWRSAIRDFSENEALIIIPWKGKKGGPVVSYNSYAKSTLGDRCFILDCPDGFDTLFWEEKDIHFKEAIINELKSALIHQKDKWNDEELHTALHALACCRQLEALLKERGYYFDKNSVSTQAWGASFEGCVTKYTLNIRRLLNLEKVIQVNPEFTVPDAPFLLNADFKDSFMLANGLRCFLFKNSNQTIGLFTTTKHSLADHPVFVRLRLDREDVIIKSKQGIRLWPQPEVYHLPQATIGHYEPPQELVKFKNKNLIIPVSAGFVYRLAKAPAYIFAGSNLNETEFKILLKKGKLVNK